MPRISVILPAYNAAAFLEAAVQSVQAQRFTDWELIIVEDGAQDDTASICDRLALHDARIRVIHKANAGVSSARNDGIDAARGELIAFLDADDLYEPEYLDEMLRAMDGCKAKSAACGFSWLYPDGSMVSAGAPMPAGLHDRKAVQQGFVLPLLHDRLSADLTLGAIWRCLFRTSLLREHGIRFSGAYLEDEIFLIAYYSLEENLVCVDKPLYRYFQNPASVTHRYLADYAQTFARALEAKTQLVARYAIPAPEWWLHNSAWAGLLIAVANTFAPGAPGGPFSRAKSIKALCALPVFHDAYRNYAPVGMNRNKTIVAALLRKRMFLALSALYTFKNRNR